MSENNKDKEFIEVEKKEVKHLPVIKRKSINISTENLVKIKKMYEAKNLPLVIEPRVMDVDLSSWVFSERELVKEKLIKHGAILFRNFNIKKIEQFQGIIEAVSGQPLEYQERSSPRSQVRGNIYTSTEHPADQSIFLHNEQSYNITYPMKIFFFCKEAARQGGETPIADVRNVGKNIDSKIKERFLEKGYMYVRNLGEGLGLSWETAFQTTEKAEVEKYCLANKIELEWKEKNRLKTWQVRPVEVKHPITGEKIWFNHLTFFNVSSLEPAIREALLTEFELDKLPNNTYYGDGSVIEPEVLEHLREAYIKEKIMFPWQSGDILVLDNLLVAHAREPFSGSRKVFVAMSEAINTNQGLKQSE